jgi:nitroimidazol reductase NimA-like FMN-containing flavoprotein (pyridoxamine 5'-phosphate oxidase superfamily)
MIGTGCGVADRRPDRSAGVKGPSGTGPLALPATGPNAEHSQMMTVRTDRAIEELAPAECLRLLASVPVGRVGVTIDALPAVLPVNFVVSDGAVVFRTVPGTKLDAATAGAVVAFEADGYGPETSTGDWSVLVRGVARELTGPDELATANALPLESWAWDGGADRFVRIEPTVLTGRRLVRPDVRRNHPPEEFES